MRYGKAAAYSAIAIVMILVIIVWAAQPTPVGLAARQTFESSTEGWFAYGTGAKVDVIHKREDVKEGSGALQLEYKAASNQYGSAVLLVTDGSLAQMRQLRFWIKTDDETAAAVVLSEKRPNGGDYAAWFWSRKDHWQLVELLPEDFVLNEGSADAKDANGRLDLDQVQAVGFIDVGQSFGSISQDPAYPLVLKVVTGTHRLQIDDFEILRGRPPASSVSRARVGDPSRGFISWITLGGASLSLSTPGKPLASAGFEVSYEPTPGKYIAIAHGLSNLDLGTAAGVAFDAASVTPATFMVYLEERNPGNDVGPRYSSTLELKGGSTPSRASLTFSQFTFDATSTPDADGRLTPDRLKTISLVDVTSGLSGSAQRNTLWLSAMDAIPR
jgi:hypothetical protein